MEKKFYFKKDSFSWERGMSCNVVVTGSHIEQVKKIGWFLYCFCLKESEFKYRDLNFEFKQFLLFKIWNLKILLMKCRLETIKPFPTVPPGPSEIYPPPNRLQFSTASLPKEMLSGRWVEEDFVICNYFPTACKCFKLLGSMLHITLNLKC